MDANALDCRRCRCCCCEWPGLAAENSREVVLLLAMAMPGDDEAFDGIACSSCTTSMLLCDAVAVTAADAALLLVEACIVVVVVVVVVEWVGC